MPRNKINPRVVALGLIGGRQPYVKTFTATMQALRYCNGMTRHYEAEQVSTTHMLEELHRHYFSGTQKYA